MFKFNNDLSRQWSKMGPRAMFGQFMIEIAKKNKKLMVLSADLGRSSGLDRFKKMFPEKYLSVGISEQNLIGVAAGLAKEGYKVFATSFAPFLSMRASEQIRMNLGYMEHPVNLVALGSGVSMAYLGNSHFGLEDIAIMKTVPNLNISSPADPAELGKILFDYSFKKRGPSYIRLTGVPGSPYLYKKNYDYKFGNPTTISKGKDMLILSTGSVSAQALNALDILKKKNISVQLINIHTIKPLNKQILMLIKRFKNIIIIEEHSSVGGLSSSIFEIIAKNNLKKNILNLNLSNRFGPTGTYNYLLNYHNLSAKKIAKKIVEKFR